MAVEGAHLVGSIPLENAETVFRAASQALGPQLQRLPDGETGARRNWIAWQYGVLESAEGLEPIPVGDRGYLRRQMVRLREGSQVRFGELGYAKAALDSFAVFSRLQREDIIAAGTRFQVSLPTPLAPITVFVHPASRAVVEEQYENVLIAELHRIAEAIPHQKLAVQWDVAVEVAHLDGVFPAHFQDVEAGVVERLTRIASALPKDVELGFHLCYGDFGHKHFSDPADASTLVRLANRLAKLDRAIDFVHMPVPIGWTDRSCYAPLADLRLQPETRFYLGLVHMTDGVEGARRRVALASQNVENFGIATECGWGRRPPETVPSLLDLHAEILQN